MSLKNLIVSLKWQRATVLCYRHLTGETTNAPCPGCKRLKAVSA